MLKSEAAAYLAGVTQTEGAEASAPTNLHVITGEVGEASADGKTLVKIDGLMFSESDDQFIEVDALGGLEEGDIATIVLTGEQGHAMTPLALGSIGSVDRITVRIAAIEADYIKVEQLDAAKARIGELEADHVSVNDFNAATGRIGTLETTRATITDLNAATARIGTLEADHVSTDDFSAATARIGTLETNTADIGTIRANSAKVQNLTAAELEADHATVGSLSTNYAHITNGVIDNATIGYADVNNLSAHYAEIQNGKINSALIDTAAIVDEQVFTVTGNKATLAQIDASKINVLNLKAKDIEVERINGQPVTNKTLVDALSQHESDISDLDSKIDDEVEALNDRIDGAIETFTGTVVPTLENTPASSWNTVKLKDQHVGDVYYVVNSQSAQNGYCYRFTKSGSTYSWQLIKDSDVTAALSRLQTAEGKIGDIETFDETVGSFMTNTDDELSSLKAKDTQLETSLGDKVSTSTFNTVSQKVDTNEANITSMSTVLTNNGLTSSTNITNTVNSVKQTADTNKASITSLTQTVNNKADGSTVTTLTNRVSTVEQNLSGITTRVGKTESAIETVSNPNLSPYLSHTFGDTDYWQSASKPNKSSELGDIGTYLGDGWMHVDMDNSARSGMAYLNCFWVNSDSNITELTKYTFLVEIRNLTFSAGTKIYVRPTTNNTTASRKGQFGTTYTIDVTESKNIYQVATTRSDFSGCATISDGYVWVDAGTNASFDIRISLYEGEYSGPYKPYVDQTLIRRVKSAETAIEQNAEDITLRATKTEAYQSAQPNLSPFFSQYKDDVHSNTNSDGYWYQSSADGFPSLITTWDFEQETVNGDGWAHFVANNTATITLYAHAYVHKDALQLKPSTKYTFLVEWLDVASTGGTPVLYTTTQHGGTGGVNNDYFTTTTSASLTSGSGSKYISATTRDVLDSGCNNVIRSHIWIGTGISTSGYIRISLYEGEYAGPYKPYSGSWLYATQSELKVANDNINLKVSKNDVINQINVSTEGAKIQASKVEIDGTAIFSAIKSSADAAYDAKGAAATVQDNLDNLEVGGRNLLPQTQNWGKVSTSNGTGTITSDMKAGCQILKFVWGSGSADVFFTGKWTRPLEANAWYTLSFWARADAAIDLRNYLWSPAVVDEGRNSVGRTTSSSDGAILTPITTSWERYWIAWHVKVGSSLPNNVMIGRLLSAGTVYFAGAKFEKGNKATDWTPAPEDQTAYVDDSISSIQVGGRNLLTDSDDITKCFDSSSNITSIVGGKADPDGGNGAYLITPNTTNWWAGPRGARLRLTKLGVSYTFSIWLRADNATQCRMCCRYMDSTPYSSNATRVNINVTTEWKRFFISAPLKQVQTGDSVWIGYLSTTPLYVYHPMVEMSSTPSDWSPAPEDQTAYVDAVKIGGRNLATGTANSTNFSGSAATYFAPIGFYPTSDIGLNLLKDTSNTKFTLSFDWSTADVTTAYNMFPAFKYTSTSYTSLTGGPTISVPTGASSGHYEYTFEPTSAQRTYGTMWLLSKNNTNTTQCGTVTISNFMFECANKASTWTPAPEDVASDIAAAQATANAAAPKASAVKRTQRIWYRTNGSSAPATPGTASSNWVTKANDGNDAWTKMHIAINSTHKYIYTCEQYEMANGTVGYTSVLLDNTITVIDGGNIITGSVTANKLNAANINASKTLTVGAMTDAAASSILNSNVVVGGRNLFADSKALSTAKWTFDQGATRGDNLATLAANASSRIYQMPAYGYWSWKPNTEYVVSVEAKASASGGKMTFNMVGAGGNKLKTFDLTTSWARYSWAFTSDATVSTGSASIYNSTNTGTVQVRLPKLEEGNKATDWTPAPEDQTAYVDDSVSSIQVGGRNLLLWTATLPKGSDNTVSGKDGIAAWGDTLGQLIETDEGIRLNAAGNSNECIGIPLANNGSVGNNEDVLLTFEARGNITSIGQFFWLQESGSNVGFTKWLNGNQTISLSETSWTKFTTNVKHAQANIRTCTRILIFYGLGSSNNGKWVEIRKGTLKLEKGNKATDWTPAPEDMATNSSVDQTYVQNLTPYFQMDMSQASDEYWANLTYARFTRLGDGWAHFEYNNTGSSTVSSYIGPKAISTLLPGGNYTLLAEFRNVVISGATNGSFYSQQISNAQIWGTEAYGGFSITNAQLIALENGEGKFYKSLTLLDAESKDPSGTVRGTLPKTIFMTINQQVAGSQSVSYDIRLSLYEGTYTGPYKPYSGDVLFATNTALTGTNESLEGAIADIGELSDQLVGTITEQNKTITTIQTYLNSLRQDLDAEIQSRQQWLNFDTAEGLVIGAKNSTFKTVTTNTSQQFRSGGTILAETSGTEFVAPVMRSDQLLIGNWMWTRRDNGNLSLKWIG